MPVTDVVKDPSTLTMRVVATYAKPVAAVWECWADPRRLEKWWGPPGYPATFTDHDLRVGGTMAYYMTSPEGEKYHGWWKVLAVDAPHRFQVEDGFGEDAANPHPDMPSMTFDVVLSETAEGTEMVITTTFPSAQAMEQVLAMGAEEGMLASLGQLDGLLAA